MQNIKSFEFAREDLNHSLHEWMLAKRKFQEISESDKEISRKISKAAYRIEESIREVQSMTKLDKDENLVFLSVEFIHFASTAMAEAVDEGTDAMLDHCENTKVFDSWQELCGAVDSFARSAAQELIDLRSKYPRVSDMVLFRGAYLLVHAAGSLEATADVALRCRKKGILGHWKGPLCEYALEDARSLRALINTDLPILSADQCNTQNH
jgi:hypothetical protein